MKHFTLQQIMEDRERSGRVYREFLREPAMSAGLYVLAAGEIDRQPVHTEDEVYYVLKGRARMRVGSHDIAVAAGSFIFVEAGTEHRFHTITEELSVLVLFAPAERL